jgi:hypothetical protein
MNIAVLFTGQIRINHDVVENIKFLFSELNDVNVDFFCSTWHESNIDYKSIETLFNFKIFDVETYNQYTTQFVENYDKFSEFCIIYKNNDPDYISRSEHDWMNGVWKNVPIVFYKFNRSIKLIEKYQELNNIKYDLIVRVRWDIIFDNKLSLEHINEVVYNNKLAVYTHSISEYTNVYEKMNIVWPELYNTENLGYHKYVDGWVDETVYYGNPFVMKLFSNIYEEYFEICKNRNCWIVHVILKEYLRKINIQTIIPKLIILLKNTRIYHYYNL